MADAAVEVVVVAYSQHTPHLGPRTPDGFPYLCSCGVDASGPPEVWRRHLADVAVAALTAAGLLAAQPVVTRSDVTLEARWRAAALEIVTAWTVPGRMPQLHQLAREQLETHWPSLAGPIKRLVQAKAELLGERP